MANDPRVFEVVGDFVICTRLMDRLAIGHVDAYSGSGWKITLFSEHARRNLERPDFIMGGSGGAITTACRAMGEEGIAIYDRYVGELNDDSIADGIAGWLTPAYWHALAWFFFPALAGWLGIRNPNGAFFMDELRKKIEANVDPKKFRCPVGFAVVGRGNEGGNPDAANLRIIVCGPDTDPKIVHDAIVASTAIALAMDTPAVDLPGIGAPGERVVVSDGGHESYLPLPTLECFPNLKTLDWLIARQLNAVTRWPSHRNRIVATAIWMLEQHVRAPVFRDFDQLAALQHAGVNTRGFAPNEDPGGTFDASDSMKRRRLELSRIMYAHPIVGPATD